jgi:predicted porin
MKKHLIALAVAGAVAAPAMAQNVSISGYVEAGYNDTSFDATADAAREMSGISAGPFGSSRLVISGSEDLGGGLKAGFRLESSMDVSYGRFGDSTVGIQQDSAAIFNRGSEINLSGAFGMVRVGKFDHLGGESTDLNVAGNVALASGCSADNCDPTGVEMGTDRNGTIAYRTPAIAGGFIEVAHTSEDGMKAAATTASTKGAVNSVYFTTAQGPFKVAAGYATQDSVGATTATNNDANRYGVGMTYDAGAFSLGASYAAAKLISQVKNNEYVLSAKVPLGNGLDIRGAYRKFDTDTEATTNTDLKEFTVAVAKALSKRSTVFAAYTDYDRTGGTLSDSKRLFLGVGHSF